VEQTPINTALSKLNTSIKHGVMGNFDIALAVESTLGCIMPHAAGKKKRGRKAIMLGVGLDTDGHKRLTSGSNFALIGGSEETHATMTEKVIKINEKLASKGKSLEQISRQEFDDVAAEVGLHKLPRNGS
jgi:hypothetical protein